MPRTPALLATAAVVLASGLTATAGPAAAVAPADARVFVNELHYDNSGTDTGELVEIAGPVGTDLTGWSVVLYNGANGLAYGTRTLSGPVPAAGVVVVDYPSNGLQNGSPDALALVDAAGAVRQLLSYEGTLTALDGPAAGLTSTDLGVREDGTEPAGRSLQLTGSGTAYGDLRWTGPAPASPGALNAGQVLDGRSAGEEPPADPDAVVPVHAVQGSGATSPRTGDRVTVEAVVTALRSRDDATDAVWVQERTADADPATSEGLLVVCGSACPAVAAGDVVRATGTVAERSGRTSLDGATVAVTGRAPLLAPVDVALPAPVATSDPAAYEAVEGMLVRFPTTLRVAEHFALARFGEVVLTAGERAYQFTHTSAPDVAGFAAHRAALATRRIVLDDASDDQNDATSGPQADEPYAYPSGGLALDRRFRAGDTATGLTAVMDYDFGSYRLRPVPGVDYSFAPANPRTAAPEPVGGRLRVAAVNVLNYFATVDETASGSSGPCGPTGGLDCRGADSAAELERQRAKTVAELLALDAHVYGLVEVQNDDDVATGQLVEALNAATAPGTYDLVRTGTIGTDAIKQALVYRRDAVQPVGPHAVLDSSVDPRFDDTRSRPALAQVFVERATGARLTVAVNHLKSKGSGCGPADPDKGDGAGNCDGTRTAAAQALADWLAGDPTGTGDGDVLVVGDLNAYRNERPVTTLEGAGYTDLVERFGGDAAYGYLFDGQLGYLDHALASTSLAGQVTGATEWHVNADEPELLDYDDTVRDLGEAAFERVSAARPLYAPDAYRSSDHDPVLVGLDLRTASPRARGLER